MTEPLPQDELTALRDRLNESALPAQARAASSEAHLTVVSAGAGTGKTWTLAWRFVWCLAAGSPAPSILTLTFTDKAAGEMRSRIAALIEDLLARLDRKTCPVLTARLAEGRLALDEAYISTLHGFALRSLREAGLNLPVPPATRVLSTPEEESFWERLTEALDRSDQTWLAARLPEPWKSRVALLDDDWAVSILDDWGARGLVTFARRLEALEASRGTRASELWDRQPLGAPLIDRLWRRFEPQLVTWAERWRHALSLAPVRKEMESRSVQANVVTNLPPVVPNARDDELAAPLAALADRLTVPKSKLTAALLDGINDGYAPAQCFASLKDFRDTLREFSPLLDLRVDGWTGDETALTDTAVKLAGLCWAAWDEYKARRGLVSFSDMIALASRVVATNPVWAARFRHVLIDEYQDTDGLQDELVSALSSAGDASLFLVGDLKQSIYRFRHADPHLLDQRSQSARERADGLYLALTVNFRSSPAVLRAVNDRFGRIYADGLGEGLTGRYEPLVPPDEPRADWGTVPVGEYLFDRPAETSPQDGQTKSREPIDAARTRLAQRLALRLNRLHLEGATVRDRETGDLRPLEWRDVTILVPGRTVYGALREGFARAGVPLVLASSVDYYARYEVRDLAALTRFLAQGDVFSLAAFLCSPFSGLTLSQAQSLLPRWSQVADPLASLARNCPNLARNLTELGRWAALRGASQAAHQLLKDDLSAVAPYRRWGVTANMRNALALLEDFERQEGPVLQAEARFLERAVRDGLRAESEPGAASDDAVTAMTIHAAKGLEFPLVVLFGLEAEAKERLSGLEASPHTGLAVARWPEGQLGSPNSGPRLATIHRLSSDRPLLDEWARLYYVGLTRARDGLILAGLLPDEHGTPPSPRSWLALENLSTERLNGTPMTDSPSGETSAPSKPESMAQDDPTVTLPGRRVTHLTSISATSHGLWIFCPAAWRAVFRQGLNLSRYTDVPKTERSPRGARLGELTHWLFEHWDFSVQGLDRLLARKTTDGSSQLQPPPHLRRLWRRPQARDLLRRWAEGFLALPLTPGIRAALSNGRLEREKPLRLDLPNNLALTGVADLLWYEERSGETWCCLRDYKTAADFDDVALTEAREQLRFYATILRGMWPDRSLRFDLAIIPLRAEPCRELPVESPTTDDDTRLFAAAQVQAVQAATGPWPARSVHCPTCPFVRDCLLAPPRQP